MPKQWTQARLVFLPTLCHSGARNRKLTQGPLFETILKINRAYVGKGKIGYPSKFSVAKGGLNEA